MESSRRDLLNDVAEYKPILKNNRTTCRLRFGFTPKTGITFPKTGICVMSLACFAQAVPKIHSKFESVRVCRFGENSLNLREE